MMEKENPLPVEEKEGTRSMAVSRFRHAMQDRIKLGEKESWNPIRREEITECCTFASNMLLKNILNNEIRVVPWSETFPGVALMADVSGFTKLTEELDRGPDGLQKLCEILNTYFEKLVSVVTAHGGDIIKFAGDAVIIVWHPKLLGIPVREMSTTDSDEEVTRRTHAYTIGRDGDHDNRISKDFGAPPEEETDPLQVFSKGPSMGKKAKSRHNRIKTWTGHDMAIPEIKKAKKPTRAFLNVRSRKKSYSLERGTRIMKVAEDSQGERFSGTMPWEDTYVSHHASSIRPLAMAAVRCAVKILEELSDYQATDNVTLNLHLGMGCGQLTQMVLGNPEIHLEHVVAGGPIEQMSHAEGLSEKRELVVSPHIWELIEDSVLKSDLKKVQTVSTRDQTCLSQLSRPFRILRSGFRFAPEYITLQNPVNLDNHLQEAALLRHAGLGSAVSKNPSQGPFQKYVRGSAVFSTEFPEDRNKANVGCWFLSENRRFRILHVSPSSESNATDEKISEVPFPTWFVQGLKQDGVWKNLFSTVSDGIAHEAPPSKTLYLGTDVQTSEMANRRSSSRHLLLRCHSTYGDEAVYDGAKFTVKVLQDHARKLVRLQKLPILMKFLPQHVINCLQAQTCRIDNGASSRFASMRGITTMFIKSVGVPLSDFSAKQQKTLERAQLLLTKIQQAVSSWEGSVNKMLVDDKGVVVLAAFGLPPLRHPDDAARAVLAGLSIAMLFKENRLDCSIGVVTGRVFCGLVGADARKEYTTMGDEVNLAARFMAHGTPEEMQVLCDAETYKQAKAWVKFDRLPDIHVKGKSAMKRVFMAVSVRKKPKLHDDNNYSLLKANYARDSDGGSARSHSPNKLTPHVSKRHPRRSLSSSAATSSADSKAKATSPHSSNPESVSSLTSLNSDTSPRRVRRTDERKNAEHKGVDHKLHLPQLRWAEKRRISNYLQDCIKQNTGMILVTGAFGIGKRTIRDFLALTAEKHGLGVSMSQTFDMGLSPTHINSNRSDTDDLIAFKSIVGQILDLQELKGKMNNPLDRKLVESARKWMLEETSLSEKLLGHAQRNGRNTDRRSAASNTDRDSDDSVSFSERQQCPNDEKKMRKLAKLLRSSVSQSPTHNRAPSGFHRQKNRKQSFIFVHLHDTGTISSRMTMKENGNSHRNVQMIVAIISLASRLVQESRKTPLLLLLDNCHLFDDNSWDVVGRLLLIKGIIMCLIMRPEWQLVSELSGLKESIPFYSLKLEPLVYRDAIHLVNRLLQAPSSQTRTKSFKKIYDVVLNLSGSNPLFIKYICSKLLEDGILTRDEDTGEYHTREAFTPSDLIDLCMPREMEDVLVLIMDNLTPLQQDIVKVLASVEMATSCHDIARGLGIRYDSEEEGTEVMRVLQQSCEDLFATQILGVQFKSSQALRVDGSEDMYDAHSVNPRSYASNSVPVNISDKLAILRPPPPLELTRLLSNLKSVKNVLKQKKDGAPPPADPPRRNPMKIKTFLGDKPESKKKSKHKKTRRRRSSQLRGLRGSSARPSGGRTSRSKRDQRGSDVGLSPSGPRRRPKSTGPRRTSTKHERPSKNRTSASRQVHQRKRNSITTTTPSRNRRRSSHNYRSPTKSSQRRSSLPKVLGRSKPKKIGAKVVGSKNIKKSSENRAGRRKKSHDFSAIQAKKEKTSKPKKNEKRQSGLSKAARKSSSSKEKKDSNKSWPKLQQFIVEPNGEKRRILHEESVFGETYETFVYMNTQDRKSEAMKIMARESEKFQHEMAPLAFNSLFHCS